MKKHTLILLLATTSVSIFNSCAKKETVRIEKISSASGTVTSICNYCTVDGSLYIPYIIVMDKKTDSVIVTVNGNDIGVNDHLNFTYKEGDTIPMAQTSNIIYPPRRVTIVSFEKR